MRHVRTSSLNQANPGGTHAHTRPHARQWAYVLPDRYMYMALLQPLHPAQTPESGTAGRNDSEALAECWMLEVLACVKQAQLAPWAMKC